jgi:CubicO group peptidase (beta-lactamase class C family)
MFRIPRWGGVAAIGCVWFLMGGTVRVVAEDGRQAWEWRLASPESQGMSAGKLDVAWAKLRDRQTTAFLVIRNDRIVFERYASGFNRAKPHYTASMAKALVGGMGLMVAMNDGRIAADDLASQYVARWRDDPTRQAITIRNLATHTSGIEDAEAGDLPHDRLTGWKGDFWKRLDPPRDPYTLAASVAPVLERPGTRDRYSNPGMAMLGYCLASCLKGTADADLRSLLEHRIMKPLGVPASEWSIGYGKTTIVDGLPVVATWGGGAYSPDAVARIGRLLLHRGTWEGRSLIAGAVVSEGLRHSGLPGHSGLAWWVNSPWNGERLWKSAPDDAFGGAGAGQQFLLVVPSLGLIVVRNGQTLDQGLSFWEGLDRHVVAPVVGAISTVRTAPYPRSRVIRGIRWAPAASIIRRARGSDNWPLTWADDGALYTAYGDGNGFEPFLPRKLSLGFARITGGAEDFQGVNIRSATGEQQGDGTAGKKASGMLAVQGVLFMWARNAGNSQLAWSTDHARTWTWCGWRFQRGFGCPTFLNFGKDYSGARDDYVYVYSPDCDSAYEAADQMVLARAPARRITERGGYEFFGGTDSRGVPVWTADIARRRPVFEHVRGCGRSAISFDAGLRRYLWCQSVPGDGRFRGGFGIYDAPEPWGPWTTVYFTDLWDVGPGETSSVPTKWMSKDGKVVYLVFSGDDSLSVRRATLIAGEAGSREGD